MLPSRLFLLRLFLLLSWLVSVQVMAVPTILQPDTGITAKQLAVIINVQDPVSIDIGEYYQRQRSIPRENVIRVRFDTGHSVMSPGLFAVMIRQIEAQLPEDIQAYALTWASPYRVGCMSMSAAFAFGYDVAYCAQGCKPTKQSQYASARVSRPYDQLNIRPTMLIAAEDFQQAKALIDRGIQSDDSQPLAAAYLLNTDDKARNVRKVGFSHAQQRLSHQLSVNILNTNAIKNKHNIMFYFTGSKFVEGIKSNDYLPGAMADHLTSAGGKLTDSYQMSAMRWLEAGVTGSYGTVVEPCNILAKFPDPLVAMTQYLQGDTLLEAYWKSVRMPGQGVFIGEPLARPYLKYSIVTQQGRSVLMLSDLSPGRYRLMGAAHIDGPFSKALAFNVSSSVSGQRLAIALPQPLSLVYKVEPLLK